MNDLNDLDFLKSMGLSGIDEINQKARQQRIRDDIGCKDCDYFGYTTNSLGKTIICKCIMRKNEVRLYEEANIPRTWWDKILDDWDTKQDSKGYDLGVQGKNSERVKLLFSFYIKKLQDIFAGHHPTVIHSGRSDKINSLLLVGGNGSGKTFLIAITLQEALKKGYSAYFIEWSDLIDTCRSFHKEEEQEQLRNKFGDYDIIAIDNVTPYDNLPNHCIIQLDRLFRARVNSGKPILIGAEVGWENTVAGSGWKALSEGCLVVSLPKIDQRINKRI